MKIGAVIGLVAVVVALAAAPSDAVPPRRLADQDVQQQDVPPRRLEGDVPPRRLGGQQQDVPPRMLEGDVPPRRLEGDVPPRRLGGQQQDVPPRMLEGDVPPRRLEGDVPPRRLGGQQQDVPPRMLEGQDVQQQTTHQSIIAEDGLEETDSDNWDVLLGAGMYPRRREALAQQADRLEGAEKANEEDEQLLASGRHPTNTKPLA